MDEIVHVIEGLSREISNTIKELSKCKDIDQKKKLAEIIKMLSESIGIFLDGIGLIEENSMFDDLDDSEYSDDVLDFKSLKKGKRNKKNDIPF